MTGVSASARVAYATPAFAMAVVGIPVYVYVPKFYTDVVGVPVAAAGALLMATRIFDALTDPLVGFLSDRTRTRWGRRRPYVLGASLPLAASLVWLLAPPETDPRTATLWFAGGVTALFLFWTLVTVPYESLGPELTFDYHERTALLGLRDGMLLAGTVVAAVSPEALRVLLGGADGPVRERRVFFWVAAVYAPLIVAACAGCSLVLREREVATSDAFRGNLRGVLGNRPFAILLASYTVAALGSNLPATLLLYYVEYVLESRQAGLFLVLYLVAGVAFLPAWVWLARRTEKKSAWLAGMALNSGAFVGVFFLGPGDAGIYGLLVAVSGAGLGATLALPSSMQADVIDYDELLSGRRREGRYVGLWSISRKLAAALGVGAALVLLGSAGYEPGAPQTPQVRTAIRTLYAGIPCVCSAVAFGIALFYPIDRSLHRAIRDATTRRSRGHAVVDPLDPERSLEGRGADTDRRPR